jgi:hypothetical protein
LRHPFALAVAGFVLTGILGTIISQKIVDRSKEAEQARIEAESRKSLIESISRSIYERRERAAMLRSSLLRGALRDEIKDRKKAYDETVVQWNSNLQANLFIIRDVLNANDYNTVDRALEQELIGKIFSPLDTCLTQAYDAYMFQAGGVPGRILEDCHSDALLKDVLFCGYVIADQLHVVAGRSASAVDPKMQKSVEDRISRNCP